MASANPNNLQLLRELGQQIKSGQTTWNDPTVAAKNTASSTFTPSGSTSAQQTMNYLQSGQLLKDTGRTSFNGIVRPDGSVIDTTGLTPQQAYARDVTTRNPNEAERILSSMGLDMGGNPKDGMLVQLRAAATQGQSAPTPTASTPQATAYQPPAQAAPAAPTVDIAGMRDRLNQALNLKQAAGLTGIRNARDTALQGYNKSETQARNQAYNQRNQVAGNSALAAKRLSEILASQGITGGDNMSANARLQASAQGNLAQIGQSEAALLQDIQERRNLTNNQAVSQENALVQESEADRLNRLLELDKYGDERAIQLDQINYGRYSDSLDRSFREQQAAIQNRLSEANITGSLNGQDTLEKLRFAAQEAGRQWQQGQAEREANLNAALQVGNQLGRVVQPKSDWSNLFNQTDAPLNMQGQQMQYQQARDQIKDAQYQQEFEENVRQFGLNYAMQKAQLDGQMANQATDNQLQWLRYMADQDPNSLDNQYKQAQIDSLRDKMNAPDVNGTMKQLESQYVTFDNVGNRIVTNPYAMRSSIIALGLSDSETVKLLKKYNLPVQVSNYSGGR